MVDARMIRSMAMVSPDLLTDRSLNTRDCNGLSQSAVDVSAKQIATTIDPIHDRRWAEFAAAHSSALVFHQPAWVSAIVQVFGYKPRFHVLENTDGSIVAAWPSMLVKSRLTGTRLVCLPFCHRVGPLVQTDDQLEQLLAVVMADAERLRAGSIETRDWSTSAAVPKRFTVVRTYSTHVVELARGPEAVLQAANKNIRYSIRRAQRDGVSIRLAQDERDIELFYRMYLDQRRRQRLLPQPRAFINAIYERLVKPGNGFIVIAERDGAPVCALLSVTHGHTAVGTHSAATPEGRKLRATSLAMWKSMELACERGHTRYDLGRSDLDAEGLIHFKEEWGAIQEELPYFFYPQPSGVNAGGHGGLSKSVLGLYTKAAPNFLFAGLSTAMYRHLG